jgi:hypothetical protein
MSKRSIEWDSKRRIKRRELRKEQRHLGRDSKSELKMDHRGVSLRLLPFTRLEGSQGWNFERFDGSGENS